MTFSTSHHFKFSVRGKIESLKTFRVAAKEGTSGQDMQLQYSHQKVIGNGSFGIVYQVKLANGEDAAIKKVPQDKRYKNRELEIMRVMNHQNICHIKAFFYSQPAKKSDIHLNIVMEYVPETAFQIIRYYKKRKQPIPLLLVKLYMYQLFRSLAYSHSLGICHRDIKPENLLVHPITGVLKLCDFGSAKILEANNSNVAYICSRYYRAPELIFGATSYTCSIDIWSAGCVMGELLLRKPFFEGETSIDQLVEIIRVLGNPTQQEIKLMNPDYFIERAFPKVKARSMAEMIRGSDEATVSLLQDIFQYDPKKRPTAIEAMVHPFFDELRNPETKMAAGNQLPNLFDFSKEELSIRPDLINKLVPTHCIKDIETSMEIQALEDFIPLPLDDLRLTSATAAD